MALNKNTLKRWLPILLVLLLIGAYILVKNARKGEDTPDLPIVTADPSDMTADISDIPIAEVTETPAPEGTPASDDTPAPTAEPTAAPTAEPTAEPTPTPTECPVTEDGQYDTRDEVALYIYLYGHLPSNYITKKQAQELGWTGGGLDRYAPGCSIGGDRFGNYEGALPRKSGRTYTECDIGTKGRNSRGAKRIVFSNDGLIYYTDDHYETFTLLYGKQ